MRADLADAGVFLVETLFGLYILAVLLRFLLQQVRADFYNPIAQFLVTVTNPPLKPLRRLIPGLFGVDLAAIVLLLALEFARGALLATLQGAALLPVSLLALGVVHLLELTLNVFLVAIFARVLLSWFSPYPNPATRLLTRLTEPLLGPARRRLPPLSGLDLSPMAVVIALVLAQILILRPLWRLALSLAF